MTRSARMRQAPPRICGGPSERCDWHWKKRVMCRFAPVRMTPNRLML